jgi:hypothetical protein
LAAADFEVAGEVLLGHQVEFDARRGGAPVSSHPHPLQRRVQFRFPKPDGPADFEVGDQAGRECPPVFAVKE